MSKITERTLKKWREEALREALGYTILPDNNSKGRISWINELNNRILRMTQELLDQYLIRR